jgi:hypothetical protein
MTPRQRLLLTPLSALPVIALAFGCDSKPAPRAETRETLKKTTQNVGNAKEELAKGGVLSDGKIHETDYLGQQAAGYRTAIAQGSKMRVDMDMTAYELANGSKPKTYEEFMEHIIKKGKPDGIQLPMLPYYQEYAYDADKQELIVIEYPERKKKVDEQWDKQVGRK